MPEAARRIAALPPHKRDLLLRRLRDVRARSGVDALERRAGNDTRLLVAVQQGGARRPLYCPHPGGGNAFAYADLAEALGSDQPFFCLEARDTAADGEPPDTIEQVAARFRRAVRGRQPRGPYLLGGWSLGGLIAFEMARQWVARGERVELLALFDPAVPGRLFGPSDELGALAWLLSSLDHGSADEHRSSLGPLDAEARSDYAVGIMRGVYPRIGAEDVRRRLRRYMQQMQSVWAYAPEPYAGPVALLRPREKQAFWDSPVPDEVWRRLAPAGRLLQVPGNHQTMMTPPNVEGLARELRRLLPD